MEHPVKTVVDFGLAASLALYLWLLGHWVPTMNGLAATLVAATCAVRFASAVRDWRERRSAGER